MWTHGCSSQSRHRDAGAITGVNGACSASAVGTLRARHTFTSSVRVAVSRRRERYEGLPSRSRRVDVPGGGTVPFGPMPAPWRPLPTSSRSMPSLLSGWALPASRRRRVGSRRRVAFGVGVRARARRRAASSSSKSRPSGSSSERAAVDAGQAQRAPRNIAAAAAASGGPATATARRRAARRRRGVGHSNGDL